MTRCLAYVGLFLLPAGALLCLEFNGCHSPYRRQQSRGAESSDPGGVGDGRDWKRLALRDTKGISRWSHSTGARGPHGHPRDPSCKPNPKGRIDPEESENSLVKKENTTAPRSAIRTQRKGY